MKQNRQAFWKAPFFSIFALLFLSNFLLQSASQAESAKHFRVGLVLPLTGTAADYGIAIKNCIELAKKDKPDLFTNIELKYEDAAYDPKTAITAFNKLIDDGTELTVTWGVSFCKALAPIAQTRKTPLVGICLDPTIAANRPYVLRFLNTTDEIMRNQAQYLNRHGVKRIGLLLAEHPYLEEATQALERNLQDGQSLGVIDQIPSTEMDLRTNILKLIKKKGEFDSIGIFLFAGQISMFQRQARDLNFDMPTFGTNFSESISEIRASRGAMEGTIFSSILIKKEFLARYKEIFHSESQLAFGAPAYELAMTIGTLFNKNTGRLTPDQIIASFATVTSSEGVASGPYKYVNDPVAGQYFQFPVVIKKIVGENFEVIQ